jgi:carbamoyltransferase
MNILGISAFYHDSAACLLVDGEIRAAAQEERFTRKKHDYEFPKHAADYCLGEVRLRPGDLDVVAFYDKPILKFERLLETYFAFAPRGFSSFLKAMPIWTRQKLFLTEIIRKELDYKGKLIFPEHHESHAGSAFFPSPFEEAATLTTDGVGEWTTTSYGIGEANRVRLLGEIHFPHSLGMLYSAFTYFTGFRVNSGEYKVMGLAPYGEPRYVDRILEHLIDVREDGSFRMNMKYFDYCAGLKMTNGRFAELFDGPPRQPESRLTQREMDLAASVQVVTEMVMLRMARHVRQVTGKKHLCLAGGVALNCVANGKILREGIFDDLWIQPAAGDAGGALGAAFIAWHHYLERPRTRAGARGNDRPRDAQSGSYLGPAYTNEEIESFLKEAGARYRKLPEKELIETTAELLAREKVIGWFQGRMEFGPRALGNRSIIGDARSRTMQTTMNLKIKFRESFRPFAPTVMEEYVSDYFEIDRPSPYMLLTADVRPEHRLPLPEGSESLFGIDKLKVIRSTIPAITHVDYSARLQTVNREVNPRYHALLRAFHEKTSCPVIINTSFNVRGEPIVCSPRDAYVCFMRTDMDHLVLNDFLLDKTEQPELKDDIDWKTEFGLD